MKKALTCAAILLVAGSASACEELASASEEKKNDTPTAVKAGDAFEHDSFAVAKGWRVVEEKFIKSPNIKGLEVTNKGGDQRTALLTFRFYKGKTVLAEVECSSNQMQAKETSALDCFSTSEKFPKGYDAIKVSDMW